MATDSKPEKKQTLNLGRNKKAFHNYTVEESLECGIALHGTEVKSVKAHHFNFVDSYVEIQSGEMILKAFQITPYSHGNLYNHDPVRPRKLLAHSREIEKLRKRVDERGYTLIPLTVYSKHGLIKIEIGLCKGKKNYDKRDDIKSRDLDREAARQSRERFD